MTFDEILAQVQELLQREQRVSYRGLKRRFALDDEYIEDLKEELIGAKRIAADEDGRFLVWTSRDSLASSVQSPGSTQVQDPESKVQGQKAQMPDPKPVSYTPAHLAERIQAEREAMEARGNVDGERKTITALFADIKGSTDLIADLDPEEARTILDPTLQLMMDAVHRYEGYVAQALGDGIFALFGAPIAHEDHPQRALYAALLMQEENRKRAEQLRREKGVNVQIRVGINTGEVVLRSIRKDDLHTDYVPVGQSTNLASRMESLATPGSILVSEQTYKLTEGYFAFKVLGQAQVKGFAEPLNIYEVEGVGPLRTKLQLSVRRGLARFIGRQSELEQLQHVWEQAKAGHGQIAAVMGEPGVGKSRLFHEFVEAYCNTPLLLRLETFSVSHGKAYPYLPLIDLLKNYFQLTTQDDERRRREKITGKVLTLDRGLEDTLPYLFFLLGIAEPTSSLQQMDGQIRRQRILDAIKRLFLRESRNQPLLIIFEDLHWLDNETQAFLQLLSESVATTRILLLVNYRPEYQHNWSGKTYFSQLRLDPLGREQAEEMLTILLGDAGETLHSMSLRQMILAKTEGNPFFMEEIVQELREQGVLTDPRRVGTAHQYADLRLPTTVQGVLTARMDRLSAEEKALLQALAVIGREFAASLLRKVVTQPEADLYRLLARLQAAEFVYEQPAFPDVEYIFKHALTQEVAYNSLLIERRKIIHERTAQAIEALYSGSLDEYYSELAHHYSRSGNTEKAVEYLHLAGQQAVQRSANEEAITHLTTALDLLNTLPDTRERAQQELALRVTLGAPLQATRSFASPEVKATYTRARVLCQQLGESRQLFPALWGLCAFHLVRGEFLVARELGEQLLGLAQREQDPALLVEAYRVHGSLLFHLGEFDAAQAHVAQSLILYDAQRHYSHEFPHSIVSGLLVAARVLWHLGYPDQARQKSDAACTLAQERSHPFSVANAQVHAAIAHQLRRDRALTQERAEAALTLTREHGFPQWLGPGAVLRGWALAEQGQSEEGISQVRQGLASHQAIGAGIFQSYFLALLAEAYGKAGQTEEGLSALAEALVVIDKTGERFYEAELHRLKGTLTLQSKVPGPKSKVEDSPESRVKTSPGSSETKSQSLNPKSQAEAETCFLKAIEISRKQQAKSLELRATMSLARLWQQQGNRHKAHQMLSEVYKWFTEGFDTKDLQEAKVLLEDLKHRTKGAST